MAGIDMNQVYGVNKTSFETVTKSSQWINLFDYFQEQFGKIDWKIARVEANRKLIRRQFSDESFQASKAPKEGFAEIAKTNTPAGKVFAAWEKYQDSIPTTNSRNIQQIQYDRVIIGMNDNARLSYSIGLPVIALIFVLLAIRFVKKDEKLVRSLDRLR